MKAKSTGKRQNEVDAAKATQGTGSPQQQSVIAELEAKRLFEWLSEQPASSQRNLESQGLEVAAAMQP